MIGGASQPLDMMRGWILDKRLVVRFTMLGQRGMRLLMLDPRQTSRVRRLVGYRTSPQPYHDFECHDPVHYSQDRPAQSGSV